MHKSIVSLVLVVFCLGNGIRAVASPLADVLNSVESVSASGRTPVVVFDLDDTLISTRERTQKVLGRFAENEVISDAFPKEARQLQEMPKANIHYDLADTLAELKSPSEATLLFLVKPFWTKRFFSNAFLEEDVEVEGASRFVNRVHRLGATIVYLTGRDEPGMGEGTRRNLERLAFPTTSHVHLIMKPNKSISDIDFKEGALRRIDQLGAVTATFENEPANMNLLADYWPSARAVYVDTIHSKKPDVPHKGIPWISDFAENE